MGSPLDGLAECSVDALLAIAERALTLLSAGCEGAGIVDLTHRLRALDQTGRMVEGHILVVAAEAQRSGVFFDDGHVSVRNWLAAEMNTTSAEGLARSRPAALVTACPPVGEQLRAGEVGVAQVRELGRARANPRCGPQLDGVIGDMLIEAKAMPFHGFQGLVREWEALVDADGAHRDADLAHERRTASLFPCADGAGGELHARFGPGQFAELSEILRHYQHAEFTADWVAAKAEHGDAACPALLARSDRQRRADALVQALRDAAAASAPAADGAAATVNVVVPWDVFQEQLAAMVEDREACFDTTSLRWRMCVTTDGLLVDPVVAVAAALTGHVRRIVIDGHGRVIDFGHRKRLFTGAAREAVLVQAVLDATRGRCLWPGCGRRRCHVDHTTEWQHGGATDLHNAAWLCPTHNLTKSRGYTTWRDPHGHWHTYRPDGSEIGAA